MLDSDRCTEQDWDGTPLLSIDTDISLDGDTERQWLVVSSDSISIARDASGTKVLRQLPRSDVRSVRTVVGVGSGRLQAQVADEWVDLLRFSNSLAHRFEKVARKLDLWLRDGGQEVEVDTLLELDPPSCPSCNLRLGPRQESCPRCLPRRQLMHRAAKFIAPYWRGSLGLCLLTIVGVSAELIPPKLQQYMVDHLLSPTAGVEPVANVSTALLPWVPC